MRNTFRQLLSVALVAGLLRDPALADIRSPAEKAIGQVSGEFSAQAINPEISFTQHAMVTVSPSRNVASKLALHDRSPAISATTPDISELLSNLTNGLTTPARAAIEFMKRGLDPGLIDAFVNQMAIPLNMADSMRRRSPHVSKSSIGRAIATADKYLARSSDEVIDAEVVDDNKDEGKPR